MEPIKSRLPSAPARPRLFIHVGHPKTGTTSIQAFLTGHRDALRSADILVPRAGVVDGAHYALSQNWYAIRSREDRSAVQIEALRREVRESRCRTVVISSEGFIQENPQRLAGLLGPDFEVFILYYIRRQDLVAESAYAQRVRNYVQMALKPPHAMLAQLTPDYGEILARLAGAFAADRILVRPFEKEAFHGGALLPDFLTAIGADPTLFPEAERRRNTAFKRHYLEFKRACNALPLLEAEHQALSEDLDRLSLADDTPQPRHLLSLDDRLGILRQCAGQNAAIARTYLGRADGELFREPPPRDDENARPFGLPPAETQHRIVEQLSAPVRDTLELLDPAIRQRLPGESFLTEPPADADALRAVILKREHDKVRRRLLRVERQLAEKPPAPAREKSWANKAKSLARGWLQGRITR